MENAFQFQVINASQVINYQYGHRDVQDPRKKTKQVISRIHSSLEQRVISRRLPQGVIRFDKRALVGDIRRVISRDLVGLEVEELLVLEFYSRKV